MEDAAYRRFRSDCPRGGSKSKVQSNSLYLCQLLYDERYQKKTAKIPPLPAASFSANGPPFRPF